MTQPAAVAETHISYVFFTADKAFKFKKPVRTPFLDFSTVAARRRAARREVELNRRLAPDVYDGVVDLVGEDGAVFDHMVMMRRLPADRRLSVLATSADPTVVEELDRVADALARFHQRAKRSDRISAEGTSAAFIRRWDTNTHELRAVAPTLVSARLVEEVHTLAHRFLAGRTPLFHDRVTGGRVVDGHGDLLADDVFCLLDGPRLLDCLEFDDALRYGDGLADAAFLAMDLERLGRPDLALHFLHAYRRAAHDEWPDSLTDHYVAYRAQVRAKVACLAGDAALADQLLRLCRSHLQFARVRIVLVGGPPGTGKSTLAAGLGRAMGWPVIRTDVVRKEMAGVPVGECAGVGLGEAFYRPDTTDAVYREALERAAVLATHGRSVIIDATWSADRHRAVARRMADAVAADLVELQCRLDPATAAARIHRRRAEGPDASDADEAVAAALRAAADPWPQATAVDTSGTPEEAVWDAARAVEVDSVIATTEAFEGVTP
ncbi:MAG TPA: AAA family ATPase [Acidimicrobiales bacterium]|nr:AAA family ATPase [Acidimicrobiales bacterium]